MNRMLFSTESKEYLVKRLKDYFDSKLTEPENTQFFQDLADTGLAWQLGPEVAQTANYLIQVKDILPPPSGFEPPKVKIIDLMLNSRKKVRLF